MKLLIALAAVSVAAGAAFVHIARDGAATRTSSATSSGRYAAHTGDVSEEPSASAIERLEHSIKLKAGSKKSLGDVRLSDGRRVRLFSADTDDSKSCFIDDDPEAGSGAGCLEGGLFQVRKAAFSVNARGGPDRFEELYVLGVAAPSIRSVAVVKADGHSVALELNAAHTFVFESPTADLEARVYPVGLRLLGPSGRLVETVTFPPAG
jgi:hypothetical protein